MTCPFVNVFLGDLMIKGFNLNKIEKWALSNWIKMLSYTVHEKNK